MLSVGVPELDAQNQELFRRADAILAALINGAPAETIELLEFLLASGRQVGSADDVSTLLLRWLWAHGTAACLATFRRPEPDLAAGQAPG